MFKVAVQLVLARLSLAARAAGSLPSVAPSKAGKLSMPAKAALPPPLLSVCPLRLIKSCL